MKHLRSMALVVLIAAGSVPAAAEDQKVVLFDSWPRGATVEIAGKPVGVTPLVRAFDEGFFKSPGTVWNRYLASPPTFVLRGEGHAPVQGVLGDGPMTWTSLNGANRFTYYLMRHAYFETLPELGAEKPSAPEPAPDPVAVVAALEKLAGLKAQGVLTEAEFEQQKARLLAGAPPAAEAAPVVATAAPPFEISEGSDPKALCARLWPFHALTQRKAKAQLTITPLGRLLDTAQAPLLSCSWAAPYPGIVAARAFVECGAKDVEATCATLKERLTLDTPVPTHCAGRLGNDFVAVLSNGCTLRAGGGVSPPADPEPLRRAVFFSALVGLAP